MYIYIFNVNCANSAKINAHESIMVFYCSHEITVLIEPFDTSDDEVCSIHNSA